MYQVNIHEAKTHLSKLIKRAIDGEEVIIAKGNKPIAWLIAFEKSVTRKLGTAKGKIFTSPDFDKPLDDFADYMQWDK